MKIILTIIASVWMTLMLTWYTNVSSTDINKEKVQIKDDSVSNYSKWEIEYIESMFEEEVLWWLNEKFLNSLSWVVIDEPLYIWQLEEFKVETRTKLDNSKYDYIKYEWDEFYKMNIIRMEYRYYDESYGEMNETNWYVHWNIWCNLDKLCYRTWVFATHYWDLILKDRIPYEERKNY